MRLIFLGTPEFAVPSLQALVAAGHAIPAVFTQPDRPKGRGNKLAASPVKEAARILDLPIYQPERIRRPENVELLASFTADMMVVVGYGQIIPQSIIDIPRYGILNVHASLLPKYRGAAPIQWAIAEGEQRTGVTIMQIDAGLDTGDMLATAEVAVAPDETAPELGKRLALLGADLLVKTIEQIRDGVVVRTRQDDDAATLAPILKKEDGIVNWSQPAGTIYNHFRGFTPWPGAYTYFRGTQVSLLRMKPCDHGELPPGVLHQEKGRVFVGCGSNSGIEILELQIAGKKAMPASAFCNGYQPARGERMGDVL
jgi:methionyl-tRNA formyltransferase